MEILGVPYGYVLGSLIFKGISNYIRKKKCSCSEEIL
jgi:hypothetical protein